jgi:hypothetical protein
MQLEKPAPSAPVGHASLADATSNMPRRTYIEYEVPASCPLDERQLVMAGERYALLVATFKLPSVFEERRVFQRIGADIDKPMIIATVQTTEALSFILCAAVHVVLDADGNPQESFDPDRTKAFEFRCSSIDGTAEGTFAAMHPAMRTLLMMGYATSVQASEETAALFLKSRRTVTR